MANISKISRLIHRDLSFFYAGVILIYAFSGFMLNHKKDFNSEYDITRKEFVLEGSFPKQKTEFTKEYVLSVMKQLGEEEKNYTKHYFPSDNEVKVFIKGGSSLVMNPKNGAALYESVKKRAVISAMNRLHYNPNRYWTIFSDIFIGSLVVITITGLIMVKGKKGITGRGGILFILGLILPLLFMIL